MIALNVSGKATRAISVMTIDKLVTHLLYYVPDYTYTDSLLTVGLTTCRPTVEYLKYCILFLLIHVLSAH